MLEELLNRLQEEKNKIFYQINEESITYQECYQKVVELSNNLKQQGTEPIIVYGHKSISQVISILACLVAKRCYIPIDYCTPKSRIEEIIKKAKPSLIIKNEPIEIDTIESLTISEINSKYTNVKRNFENTNKNAYIIFTSGSTGSAKGVPITYQNLNHFIEWITTIEPLNKYYGKNTLSVSSFSFDLSLMDLYFSLYTNSTIISLDNKTKEDISKILSILKEKHIHFLIMTPTFIKMLLIGDYFNQENFPDIQYMFFCGECLEVETAKKIKNKFPKIHLINAYGPTEATCCVSLIEIKNNMLKESHLPVGKISTSAVNISIKEDEIILKGESVFSGYLDTNSKDYYQENTINCYKTKDIGKIQNDYLYCLGRLDNQIKYQGYRIELEDIENNLLKIKAIHEAVVIAKKKENSNTIKLIKAFVTINQPTTEETIKKELEKLIPHYMIPKKIIFLDKIPTTTNGKYDRRSLNNL